MTATYCGVCNEETVDGQFICSDCVSDLRTQLAGVPDLVSELETSYSRQGRLVGMYDKGSPSADTPLPFDTRAAKALDALTVVLARTATLLDGHKTPSDQRTATNLAWRVSLHADALSRLSESHKIFIDLIRVIAKAERVIDRPAAKQYLGPCGYELQPGNECAEELFGFTGEPEHTCKACGYIWDQGERRAWLLSYAKDQLTTEATALRSLPLFGQRVSQSTFASWVRRRQLVAHGKDQDGHALYRLADVIEMLTRQAA